MDREERLVRAEFRRNEDRWLSVPEIAEHIGIKQETVYTWIAQKGLPAHKVGRL
jgi:excisionase family DNA binding protein